MAVSRMRQPYLALALPVLLSPIQEDEPLCRVSKSNSDVKVGGGAIEHDAVKKSEQFSFSFSSFFFFFFFLF